MLRTSTWVLLTLAVGLASIVMTFAGSPAAHAAGLSCAKLVTIDPTTHAETVSMKCSGASSASDADSNGGSGTPGCSSQGTLIPCTLGDAFYSSSLDCYIAPVVPQPDPVYAPSPGAVAYQCKGDRMGGVFDDYITAVFWLPAGDPGTTLAQAQAAVWDVLAGVTMPKPAMGVGPAPSLNEWNMAVVGYPLWFWTTESSHEAASATRNGVDVTIDAARTSTTFDFGDGTGLTCTTMTPYPATPVAMIVSPDCGHVYQQPSLPAGTYPIKVTAHWRIHWTAAGFTGTETRDYTETTTLRVGELQSVRVG